MTPRDNRVTLRATPARSRRPAAEPHDTREARGMLRVLGELGYDVDALLGAAGLDPRDVANPDAVISPSACAAVFAAAHRERRVSNLALQLAMRTPVGTTPLLDYLVVTSDSVGEAVRRLVRYLRLVSPGIGLALDEQSSPMRLVVEQARGPFAVELTVAMSLVRIRQETEGRLQPIHVSFKHEPGDVAEYAAVLGCPIRVRATWNGWALSKASMSLPFVRRDPALGRWLEQQAADVLEHLPADGDVRDDVRRVLSVQLTKGDLRIEIASRRLATTPRTLQRRLSRAGTTFGELCDQTRKEAAQRYLSDGTLTIGEIAYLLGYSEPTAFHRAFRRWFRTTPIAFRAAGRSER